MKRYQKHPSIFIIKKVISSADKEATLSIISVILDIFLKSLKDLT